MWLHNLDWKVSPSIDFVDGYPLVLTYKDHDGGCNLIQIYCLICRTNIPSPVSDQFFHDVFKPLTVKNMIVGYNSTGYKISEQRISWNGSYYINVPSVGNTNCGSILIHNLKHIRKPILQM